MLWFDVEHPKETTESASSCTVLELWFDVEHPKETTQQRHRKNLVRLWFDVEHPKETTTLKIMFYLLSCGLM